MKLVSVLLSFLFFVLVMIVNAESEFEGVIYAKKCEACKILAIELQGRLDKSVKNCEHIDIGYSFDKENKIIKYRKSELRLIESLDRVCDEILNYNIHKERTDSTRFAKGVSMTFKTLHGLVDKGIKVDLGIPQELWDKPSVEITDLKLQCESIVSDYDEVIEEWYWHQQDKTDLKHYLCSNKVLLGQDNTCLYETLKIGS